MVDNMAASWEETWDLETYSKVVMLARPALCNPSIFSSTPSTDRTSIIQEYFQHARSVGKPITKM